MHASASQALELYGEAEEEALSAAVERVVEAVCAWVEGSGAATAEDEPELLTAFFEMCHRCLVFRPGATASLLVSSSITTSLSR